MPRPHHFPSSERRAARPRPLTILIDAELEGLRKTAGISDRWGQASLAGDSTSLPPETQVPNAAVTESNWASSAATRLLSGKGEGSGNAKLSAHLHLIAEYKYVHGSFSAENGGPSVVILSGM
jgi:hypothetical protein